MKANATIGTEILPGNTIRFHVKGAGFVDMRLDAVSESNKDRAMIHGFIQRISDAAAIGRDPETGKAADPATKLEAMSRLVAHYETGTTEWSRVQAAGPRGGLLFEALCRMYPDKAADAIRTYLDGLSDKQQAALREDDEVAPVIAAIKAEKAKDQPKMDTKGLLAGLK